jgi:hypothetical protein
MVYLVAYDLDLYHVDYISGLKEPGIPSQMTDSKKLVSVGNIPIYRRDQTVGVFIGGFKREHGIITRGPHRGKRYGYVQNGITLEPLNPGLATFFSTRQHIEIAAWSPDAHGSEQIVSARQNGVPLIESLEPTPLVKNWAWGHWSGDAKGNLQSLRSAICIQKHKSKRFLIFAAFTAATPSSMAKTLQAYRCENALHLDMNAYMYVHNALIDFKSPDKVQVEYLHQEMEYPKGLKNHRFILDNNERDFFYVYRKP